MRFDCDWKENWHRKFAWLPIKVSKHDCRWLEYVERKGTYYFISSVCGFVDGYTWEYK